MKQIGLAVLAICIVALLTLRECGHLGQSQNNPSVSLTPTEPPSNQSAEQEETGGATSARLPANSDSAPTPESEQPLLAASDQAAIEPIQPEPPSRVQHLDKAKRHVDQMPRRSAREEAQAANVLLCASVMTILDARGDFVVAIPGVEERDTLPPRTHRLHTGERIYTFSAVDFPEYTEITEILRGRGTTVHGIDIEDFGTTLAPSLWEQVELRFQEARGLAWQIR